MASGDEPRRVMTSVRSSWRGLSELGGAAVFGGAFALLVLMMLGLAVRDLSAAVGVPLPYVHDDPDRIEWAGLAELVGYGLAGALTLCALYAFGQRALPATARGHIGRVSGAAVLLVLAVSGAWVAIEDWDPAAAIFALSCGYGAYRVARGLPLDDEQDERQHDGPPHDAI